MVDGLDVEQLRPLFEVPPSGFVAARNTLAKQLRAAKQREAATLVAAIRRPSWVDWALNQVALNMLKGEKPASGQDLKWPLGGYGDIKVDGELILGNDIQEYRKGQFNGEYPF